jgi:hypothetical protein
MKVFLLHELLLTMTLFFLSWDPKNFNCIPPKSKLITQN